MPDFTFKELEKFEDGQIKLLLELSSRGSGFKFHGNSFNERSKDRNKIMLLK